jgi:hypothetical protein
MGIVSMERKRGPPSKVKALMLYTVKIRSLQPTDYLMMLNLLYEFEIHLYAIILSHAHSKPVSNDQMRQVGTT